MLEPRELPRVPPDSTTDDPVGPGRTVGAFQNGHVLVAMDLYMHMVVDT